MKEPEKVTSLPTPSGVISLSGVLARNTERSPFLVEPRPFTCETRRRAALPHETRRKARPPLPTSLVRPRFGGAFSLRALWLKDNAATIACQRKRLTRDVRGADQETASA
jgi:hypothetical protein